MNEISQVLQERFLLQKEYLGDNKPINKIQPLVSVSVPTYQQVKYISECLDGILMQQTSFVIEIIIGDDGSTDGTREICEKYAKRYQHKIRLFNRDRKLSQYVDSEGYLTRFNGIWNRMSARGKYLAICEGDDYWTDPLKLQKQIDFLESNSDCGLVHTNFNIVQEGQAREYKINRTIINDNNTLESLLLGKYDIGTLTVVFRKEIYDSLPFYYITQHFLMGDLPLWLEFAKVSRITYISDCTASYRRLDNSASHSSDFNKRIKFLESTLNCRLFYAGKFKMEYLNKKIIKNYEIAKLKFSAIEGTKENTYKQFIVILKKYNLHLPLKVYSFLFFAIFPNTSKKIYAILNKLQKIVN